MGTTRLWRVPQSVMSVAEEYLNDPDGLTEAEVVLLRRFLIRLRNVSRKAVNVAEMFDRGEIDRDQMLELGGG